MRTRRVNKPIHLYTGYLECEHAYTTCEQTHSLIYGILTA